METPPASREAKGYTGFMLQRTNDGDIDMTTSILTWFDRTATTIGNTAFLAVLPLAAITLLVHGI